MRTLKQRKYALHFPKDEGRTEQSHVPDTDINIIMKRALRGETTPYLRDTPELFGTHNSLDMFEAHNIIREGETMFADLPSTIRNRFNNNIGEFLDFIQDDENMLEASELGLIPKPKQKGEPIPEPDTKSKETLKNDDPAPPEPS